MPTHNPDSLPSSADLVIVGAGVAGLYCAWSYLRHNPNSEVVVLERLNRTGGRLQTDLVEIEADDGTTVTVREEEGGMRFTYQMPALMRLFKALGLCDQIVPFPMKGPHQDNRFHFRGRSFTTELANEDPAIWSELYDLKPGERNRAPTEILSSAFHRLLDSPENEDKKDKPRHAGPDWWRRFRLQYEWAGTTLKNWQLWGLLRDMGYSEGCCQMLAHALGFQGTMFSRMNAGVAFQLLEDFPEDPHFHTFKDGYSTLPDRLVTEIEDMGGTIFCGVNVNEIDAADEDSYELHCTIAPGEESATPYNGSSATIAGSTLILAVARKALEDLWHTSPVLNRRHAGEHARERGHQLWENLQTATEQQLLKINLYYRQAWWRSLPKPVQYGPSFTDLPVGSVYPFYSLEQRLQQDDALNPPPKDLPAALTIYCDWDNANFWKGLQEAAPDFESSLQKTYSNKTPQRIFPASQAVVDEATRLFKLLYSTPSVPEPVMTSFRLWDGESDFGYAVHQWALGADDAAASKELVNPVGDVYTCGEAFSDMQGWVEGSLRSADRVLDELPNVAPLSGDQCTSAEQGDEAASSENGRADLHPVGPWGVGSVPLSMTPDG